MALCITRRCPLTSSKSQYNSALYTRSASPTSISTAICLYKTFRWSKQLYFQSRLSNWILVLTRLYHNCEWIRFIFRAGTASTPPHPYNDFKLKVYAPHGFKYLRRKFNLDEVDFMVRPCYLLNEAIRTRLIRFWFNFFRAPLERRSLKKFLIRVQAVACFIKQATINIYSRRCSTRRPSFWRRSWPALLL